MLACCSPFLDNERQNINVDYVVYGLITSMSSTCTRLNSLRPSDVYMRQLTIIGSDKGLSPSQLQATIWTNTGILLIGPLGTNFKEMLIEIRAFPSKKMHLKMSPGRRRPSCLGLNMLITKTSRIFDLQTVVEIDRCALRGSKILTASSVSMETSESLISSRALSPVCMTDNRMWGTFQYCEISQSLEFRYFEVCNRFGNWQAVR